MTHKRDAALLQRSDFLICVTKNAAGDVPAAPWASAGDSPLLHLLRDQVNSALIASPLPSLYSSALPSAESPTIGVEP